MLQGVDFTVAAGLICWANVHFYQELMAAIRAAIAEGRYEVFKAETLERLSGGEDAY